MFELMLSTPAIERGPYIPTPLRVNAGFGPTPATRQFGYAILPSKKGDLVLITAPETDDYKGAVYLFNVQGNNPQELSKFQDTEWTGGGSDTDRSYGGRVICASADLQTVAISAPFQGSDNVGAVYIVNKAGSTYSRAAKISSPVPVVNGNFGNSTAMNELGTLLAVSNTSEPGGGAVYIYTKGSNNQWTQSMRIGPPAGGSWFGYTMGMSSSGEYLMITNDTRTYIFRESTFGQFTVFTEIPKPQGYSNYSPAVISKDAQYIYIGDTLKPVNGSFTAYKYNSLTMTWALHQTVVYPGPATPVAWFSHRMIPVNNGSGILIGNRTTSPSSSNINVMYFQQDNTGEYIYQWGTPAGADEYILNSLAVSENGRYWMVGYPLTSVAGKNVTMHR